MTIPNKAFGFFTLRSSLRKCSFNSQLQYHYCLGLSAPLFSHDANEPLCTKAVCCWMLVSVNSFMSDAYVYTLLSVFRFVCSAYSTASKKCRFCLLIYIKNITFAPVFHILYNNVGHHKRANINRTFMDGNVNSNDNLATANNDAGDAVGVSQPFRWYVAIVSNNTEKCVPKR